MGLRQYSAFSVQLNRVFEKSYRKTYNDLGDCDTANQKRGLQEPMLSVQVVFAHQFPFVKLLNTLRRVGILLA